MKHNSNKTALIAFSSTLAVLVIVTLVCTALFAGASDEAEPVNSVVNNNVVYVGVDKEPTEEDISAALAEWDRRREAANAGTPNEDVTVEKTIYDIDKYIAIDNPDSIYAPVESAAYNIDLKKFINEQTEKMAYKIDKVSGVYHTATVSAPYYKVYDFSANRRAFTAYATESVYVDNAIVNQSDSYATADAILKRSDNSGSVNSEAIYVMNKENKLPNNVAGLLFRSTPRLVMQPQNGEYSIKDYGTYLGRKAFRVTGMNYPDKDGGYYVEKTGAYTYEFIFDVETNCTLATIFYGADGEITFYAVLTEFSTSSDIVVPELVK